MGEQASERTGELAGFTLIEVLVAVAILATGVVVVMRAFDTSIMALAASRETLVANELIREKMSEVELSLAEDSSYGVTPSRGRFDAPYEDFRYTLSVDRVDTDSAYAQASNVLNRIMLTVGRQGSRREQTIVTYMRSRL